LLAPWAAKQSLRWKNSFRQFQNEEQDAPTQHTPKSIDRPALTQDHIMAAKSTIFTSITPDEQYTWTRQEMAQQLPGLAFTEPGWYSRQGTWMLIAATDIADVFALQVFYDRDPRSMFKAIAEASVRLTDQAAAVVKSAVNWKFYIFMAVGILLIIPLDLFMFSKLGMFGFLLLCLLAYGYGSLARFFFIKK
jgi:hypothetical protein